MVVIFHNFSNYEYHFIIKELANEFEGQFERLGKNTEMEKKFSVSIEKEVTNIDKDGNESTVNISYKKSIDRARFMGSLLSNLVDNLTDRIHKIKCKDCFLKYESVNDNLIKYICLSCNKDYLKRVDEKLKKRFKNPFKLTQLIMISINLFCCLETLLTLMITWMTGNSLVKQHYLKKKNFVAT